MSKTTKTAPAELAVKAVGDERKVTFVVSSGRQDRDYERVDVKSLRIPLAGGGYVAAKDLNGSQTVDVPWLLNHSFDVEDVIGSVRSARYDAAADELIFEFGVSKRQKAQDMLTLIEEGHLNNAVSITMSDYTFDEQSQTIYDAELIEVSLVFRGSNKDARLLAVKSLIKGEEMTEVTTLDEKKAQLAALTKEIETEEANTQEVVQPETPTSEVVPTAEPVPEVEAQPEAQTPVVAQPEVAEDPAKEESAPQPEAQPPQAESKSVKQEQTKVSNTDPIVVKQVQDAPTAETAPVKAKAPEMDKYDLAAAQFVAFVTKDSKKLAELNQKALETYRTKSAVKDAKSKASYMNTGVVADGGAIVPSAELLTDIYTTLGDFSTVANDLRVITLTEGDSLDVATLVADVVMTEVGAEGGKKSATKPTLGDGNVALREFAGIAIITKKLVRQAAVNVYDILRESFARAIANQRAVLALTDSSSGIANKSGVVTVTAAATHTTVDKVTWSDVRKMPYSIPVAAVQGAKYYISRELLEALDGAVDANGRDLDIVTLNGDGLSGRFKNGFDFAVEEVLGKSGAPHAVFGAMGRFGILLRQGAVENETFDTGTVNDGTNGTGGTDHNLLQENKLADRVAFYENVGYPLPGAFAILELAAS